MKRNIMDKNKTQSSALNILFVCCYALLSRTLSNMYFVANFPNIANLYTTASKAITVLIFGYYIIYMRKENNRLFFCVLAFFAMLFISTIINKGDLRRCIMMAYPMIAMAAFISIQCKTLQSTKGFLRNISNLYLVLVAANLLFALFFKGLFTPQTITTTADYYLLGGENHISYPLTIGLIYVFLDTYFNGKRNKLFIYMLMYFLTVFHVFSASFVVGSVVVFLFYFIPYLRKLFSKIPLSASFLIIIIINILLVFSSSTILNFEPIKSVIVDFLGKKTTLTDRVNIWEQAIIEILKSPFIGYGVRDSYNLFAFQGKLYSAHNQYLQTLYEGGFLTFAIVLISIFMVSRALKKSPDKKYSGIVHVVIISNAILLMAEASGINSLIELLCVGFSVASLLYNLENSLNTIVVADEMPRISIVVPVYNVEKYIERCLDSIVNQTYKNLEIILVNDGSTDDSLSVCERYAKTDDRIKIITQDNAGLSAARNTGMNHATSELITFIDSDDTIDLDCISYMYNCIVYNNADMAVCQAQLVDETDQALETDSYYLSQLIEGNFSCMAAYLKNSGINAVAWGKLYKTEHFNDVKYPVEKYNEDVFTTYKLVAKCERIFIGSKRMYMYRQRTGSIMRSAFSPKHLDAIEGKLMQEKFIIEHYPRLTKYAKTGVVYALNVCTLKIMQSSKYDEKIVNRLQEMYRKYLWNSLTGELRPLSKVFALLGSINLNIFIKIASAIFRAIRR